MYVLALPGPNQPQTQRYHGAITHQTQGTLESDQMEADLSEFKEGSLDCKDGEILTQVPMKDYEHCFFRN